jgi:hypothetical protein
MSQTSGKLPVFRILKGDHVSHFHQHCPQWPKADYYEQDKPLWWGKVCARCGELVDEEARGNRWPQDPA